ncbi:hypothetical protein BG005_007044 [Podila minutissima]|nr:hypothetical protein BG005_007044 [Podila minutissima]
MNPRPRTLVGGATTLQIGVVVVVTELAAAQEAEADLQRVTGGGIMDLSQLTGNHNRMPIELRSTLRSELTFITFYYTITNSRHRHSSSRRDSRSRSRSRSRSKSPSRRSSKHHRSSSSRHHRHHKSKRSRRSRSRSSSSGSSSSGSDSDSDSDDSRRKRRKRSSKNKKDRKDRKKDKKKSKKEKKSHASKAYGTYGILTQADMWNKENEFQAWLMEVKHLNPETIPQTQMKQHFLGFMEDYNTVTMPHEKFYNLAQWEDRQRAIRMGEPLPESKQGMVDLMNDEEQLRMRQRDRRKLNVAASGPILMTQSQVQELRKVQNERVEADRLRKMGFDAGRKGVRYE